MSFFISNRNKGRIYEEVFMSNFEDEYLFEPFNVVRSGSGSSVPVILDSSPDLIKVAQWGMVMDEESIGSYGKDLRGFLTMDEFMLGSQMVDYADGRCLVLCDGLFMEHKTTGGVVPYYIYLDGYKPFALPGIYKYHEENFYSVAVIIDSNWNPFISKINDDKKGLPIIMESEFESIWVHQNRTNERVGKLLTLKTANRLFAHTISKEYTKMEYDNYGILNPMEYENVDLNLSSLP